jgi:pachytene checkpoint protein 2
MGKTQRAVSDLFAQSITEAATRGPTIVLLDEVETLAADRNKLSLDANPVDVHRATDAVLVQLDALADQNPHLLFVATSNFPKAVDAAFTSRCDLVVHIPLPDAQAIAAILTDCLNGLGQTYPAIGKLAKSADIGRWAAASVGLDGRAIRKMVANALASTPAIAMDPNTLTSDKLLAAAKAAATSRLNPEKKARRPLCVGPSPVRRDVTPPRHGRRLSTCWPPGKTQARVTSSWRFPG